MYLIVKQSAVIGTTDTITFEAFIIRKLVPKLWKGACVVLDNCTIHTSEEIEKAIKSQGAKLIYLSPYSPDFSPIEHLWSKLKNILRSIKTTNYRELAKAIEFAFNQVTLSDLWNWFTHCCYCTSSQYRQELLVVDSREEQRLLTMIP